MQTPHRMHLSRGNIIHKTKTRINKISASTLFIHSGRKTSNHGFSSCSLGNGKVHISDRLLEEATPTEGVWGGPNIKIYSLYLWFTETCSKGLIKGLEPSGPATTSPNLLLILTLAASWRWFGTTLLLRLPVLFAIAAIALILIWWNMGHWCWDWIVHIRSPGYWEILRSHTLLFTATFDGRYKLRRNLGDNSIKERIYISEPSLYKSTIKNKKKKNETDKHEIDRVVSLMKRHVKRLNHFGALYRREFLIYGFNINQDFSEDSGLRLEREREIKESTKFT